MIKKEAEHVLLANGYTQDSIEKLSLKELKAMAEAEISLKTAEPQNETKDFQNEQTEAMMDVAKNTEAIAERLNESSKSIPTINDPEWTDYVLSQMTDNEKDNNGNPKADGLRRIAGKLLGTFDSITEVVQAPTIEGRATVMVKLGFHLKGDDRLVTICGAADVFHGNTERTFAKHPVATAETRAEGRALRKALRLTKVLTAEEAAGAEGYDTVENDPPINELMVNSLTTMCFNAGINLEKLVKFKFNTDDIKSIKKSNGVLLSDIIVKYRTGKEQLPDDIKE